MEDKGKKMTIDIDELISVAQATMTANAEGAADVGEVRKYHDALEELTALRAPNLPEAGENLTNQELFVRASQLRQSRRILSASAAPVTGGTRSFGQGLPDPLGIDRNKGFGGR